MASGDGESFNPPAIFRRIQKSPREGSRAFRFAAGKNPNLVNSSEANCFCQTITCNSFCSLKCESGTDSEQSIIIPITRAIGGNESSGSALQ